MDNKLLVICGPTATGKTALGIKLAKKFNGEIISADSRQVYKYMDIGTGKEISNIKYQISKRQIKDQEFSIYKLEEIPVWLWDVVEPDQEFSVADYHQLAWQVIEDIWQRGKLPFLVGGTGFYIKAVTSGIESLGIPPDWELRKQFSNLAIEQLRAILEKTCPERLRGMNDSDRKNPRRLIRAIEIVKWRKEKFHYNTIEYDSKKRDFQSLFICLAAPYKILYQRIDERVEKRVQEGIIGEMKTLLAQGYSWENSALRETIGYKEWQLFFDGKETPQEVIARWKFAEHDFARRQMTWFKKIPVYWFDITQAGFDKEVESLVRWFYAQKN